MAIKIWLPALIQRLPPKFRWTPHNLIGHPMSEILHLLGEEALSDLVHDATLPRIRNAVEARG